MNGKHGPSSISTKQSKIAASASIKPERALTTLAHHIDLEWLYEAYRRTRKNARKGRWVVVRGTAKDRFARALKSMWLWCRRNRHRPLDEQQALINRKLIGHYNYYGIAGNSRSLGRFRFKVQGVWCYWLRRRTS